MSSNIRENSKRKDEFKDSRWRRSASHQTAFSAFYKRGNDKTPLLILIDTATIPLLILIDKAM
jgi:hypothetical protein